MLLPAIYRAVYMGFMFAANLILANLLAPSGLGMLSLLVLNASLVSLVTGIGSDAMALHALVQKKWTRSYGLSFQVKMTGIQLLAFALLECASILLLNQSLLAAGDVSLVWVECLYFIGLVFTEKTLVLCYSQHQSKKYNQVLLISGIVYLLGLALVWMMGWAAEVQQLLLIAALHSLLQGLVLLFVVANMLAGEKLVWINWREVLVIVGTSVVVMVTNVVQLLAYRVDYWMLRRFYSNYEVGLYAQANKFAGLLWLLPNILAMLLIPRFSAMEQNEIPAVFRLGNLLNLLMLLATAAATWVIYQFFLLDQYRAGLEAFWLMLPGYFCWALVIYFGAYYSWKGAFRINLLASAFCLVLIFVLDWWLIPFLGIKGAAIANTVAYSSVLLLYLFLFIRFQPFTPASLLRHHRKDFAMIKKLIP